MTAIDLMFADIFKGVSGPRNMPTQPTTSQNRTVLYMRIFTSTKSDGSTGRKISICQTSSEYAHVRKELNKNYIMCIRMLFRYKRHKNIEHCFYIKL